MLRFDNNENGGTIIDLGSTVIDFPVAIYNHIVGEFASHSGYRRAHKVEVDYGFGLCYTLSSVEDVKFGVEEVKFLEFAFHFKGGFYKLLPYENTFIHGDSHSHCFAMTNSTYSGGVVVTLENYQHQNFYILYRDENRLGFIPKTC